MRPNQILVAANPIIKLYRINTPQHTKNGYKTKAVQDNSIGFSALGKRLVTHQTGAQGKVVYRLYIEEATKIDREIYLGFVLDRKSERVMVVASSSGGMEIEEIALKEPSSIVRESVEPAVGMQAFQAREIAFALGLSGSQIKQAVDIIMGCYRAFRELDATMVEINPLVVTQEGGLLALGYPAFRFRVPGPSEFEIFFYEDGSPAGYRYRDQAHKERPLVDVLVHGEDVWFVADRKTLTKGWKQKVVYDPLPTPAMFKKPDAEEPK